MVVDMCRWSGQTCQKCKTVCWFSARVAPADNSNTYRHSRVTLYATLRITSIPYVAFMPRGNLLKAFISAVLVIWWRSISVVNHGVWAVNALQLRRHRHAFASQRQTSYCASGTATNLHPSQTESRIGHGERLQLSVDFKYCHWVLPTPYLPSLINSIKYIETSWF